MTEEQVTKTILKWLIKHAWRIVCYDFPQSGTGHFLHPNGTFEKNKDSINPDIVAVKNSDCLFFENKDRYYQPDYKKINKLINDNHYTYDISQLLSPYNIDDVYYGIGLPSKEHDIRSIKNERLVDFIVGVNDDYIVSLLYAKDSTIENKFV